MEIAEYPETDLRSSAQRIEAKIIQLQQNPNFLVEEMHQFLSESTPGIMIKYFNGERIEIQAIFVEGQREFYLSSESFEATNLQELLAQTEVMVQSFRFVQPETEEG
ncbi:MAG: hypothetical protein HOL48_03590 [Porticoccaceae bacterium]|nr:hypothetical protein [Porticoccaceae bacterium]